jgi:hypothetical protein
MKKPLLTNDFYIPVAAFSFNLMSAFVAFSKINPKTGRLCFIVLAILAYSAIGSLAAAELNSGPIPPPPPVTLYTYQSGAWDNIDVWTTDPGGTTLVGSKIPSDGDAIVVLPSRTLTLRHGNVTNSGLNITIQESGILDDSIYTFTQTLSSLSGQGTLKLKTTTFPSAVINTFVTAGGGTVEYYYNAADYNLPAQTAYNNLTINSSGRKAIQTGNFTIYGNLNVQNGTYQINDGTANRRTLVIYGDINVNTGASISVGTGNTTSTSDPTSVGQGGTSPFLDYYITQSHQVEIYGNLTNNGTVKFTNQAYPVFNAFPNNGIASVFFRGSSDNTLTCNGTTDFYNIIVDKGTDQTYILNINSAGYDKFRIFGANNATEFTGSDANNPNIRKALWIRTGTLKLNGYVIIPSLVEGSSGSGDYFIPGNGALVLDGPDVVVMGTIDDYRAVNMAYNVSGGTGTANGVTTAPSVVASGFSLYGKFQMNDGYLYVGEIGRIIYFGTSTAEFVINGGTIDAKQFQSVSGGGKTAYWQKGGTLILRGRFKRNLDYTSRSTMISSIGNLSNLNTARAVDGSGNNLGTDQNVGTFNVDQDANVFHMEGGTIKIFDASGTSGTPRALEINSDPVNVDVTGGSVEVYLTAGSVLADASYGIATKAPLYNLTIYRSSGNQSASLLAITVKAGVTAMASPPLMVLNNLTLTEPVANASAVLNSSGYDVKVGGNFSIQTNAEYSPGSNHTVLNGTGAQTFTNSGTITTGLNKFFIEKISGTATLGSNITVLDSLAIFSGTLNDGGYILQAGGNLYNAGTHISTGSGKIQLNGSVKQYISASTSASFGNLEVRSSYNTSPYIAVTLNSDISVNSIKLSGTRGVLYIADNKLTVGSGGILLGNNANGYSASKMIMTDGSFSSKGVKLALSLTGNLNLDVDTIPVGVYHSGTTPWYTQLAINVKGNLGATVYSGGLTVIPVDHAHPASDPGKPGDVIPYFWKISTTGTLPGITSSFITYKLYNSYVSAPGGAKHAYLESGSTAWVWGSNYSDPLIFNVGFISGDFTSGKNPSFNAPQTCYAIASGYWDQAATWSPRVPLYYDYAVVSGSGATNYQVTVRNSNGTGNPNCGGLTILANGIAGDASKPTVIVNAGLTGLNFTAVNGGGKFVLKGNNTLTLPAGDFGNFCNNDTAIFVYDDDGASGSNYTLPSSITIYPNLHITNSRNGLTRILPDVDIEVRKNLRLYSAFSGNQLILNNSSISRRLTVSGDIEFRDASQLVIPVTTGSKTIAIYGNINFRYGNTDHINSITVNSGAGTIHKFYFYGSTITSGNSLMTFFNATGSNQMDFYFLNPGNTTVTNSTGASNNFNFNNLIINKDVQSDNVTFQNNFKLWASSGGNPKALRLSAGTLNIENALTDINLSSGGTSYFTIPSTSALILRNGAKVNITGNSSGSGIRLDGLLQAEGTSEINLADGTSAKTGYIEYTGSGNAVLNLQGASILKVDQIRRSTSLTTGILSYTQSGSSATTVYGQNANNTRAKFEITGTGTIFNMSGTSSLTIIGGGGGTTFGDLYLQPASSSISGGDIFFGTGTNSQTFRMDASVDLNNITLYTTGAANTLNLLVNPLVLKGNLLLNNANSIFNANSINVTIKGNFTNNGTYNAGTNNTTFNGTVQTLGGSSTTGFYDLTVSPATSLSLTHDVLVNNNITVSAGSSFIMSASNVEVKGNVTNNGILTNNASPATNGLYLHGSTLQYINGTGTYGRIELNNASGARITNNLSLTEDLTLTSGVFNINQYLLTLGVNSIIRGSGFGINKMILPDGVFSNIGIKKYFNGGYSGTFVFPIGVSGKYAPANLIVTATNAGFLRINTINDKHPATLSPYNVLKFFWEGESSVSGFQGTLTFNYDVSDVVGTESNYVAARLIVPPGTNWSKAATGSSTDNVNETTHVITFDFPAGTNELGGQYTAGEDASIPNIIPVYTSNVVSGNWETPTSWTPTAPAGGPNGYSVVILPGHTIYANGNKRFSYNTTINGTLDLGTTYGHNLGTVSGTGRMKINGPNIPAGRFDSFFSCSGGSLEFSGNSDYTIIADRLDVIRNLFFTGTGVRTLPDKDLVICNQLEINGPTVDNSVNNRKLSIGGTFDLTYGIFLSGTGSGATVVFNGSVPQSISGFNTASGSPLNNLQINNSNGLTCNSVIEMNGDLLLTNGVIVTSATNMLKMINQSSTTNVVPTGGSSSSYVNGPMSKYLFSGNNFVFPTGKGTRYGKIQLLNVQNNTWQAEYFNSKYANTTVTGTLSQVSSTEYWRVVSPADGSTAKVQLRWDTQSDISPVTTLNGINDIKVAEFNGTNWAEKSSDVPTGDNDNGTVQTSANITINNSTHPQYYTLGSTSTVKPTITLGTNPQVCASATSASLPYTATSGNPDRYKIIYDATAHGQGFADVSPSAILPASPVILTVPGSAVAGTYNGTIQVWASATPSNISVAKAFTVTLNPLPAAAGTITGSAAVCQGQTLVAYSVPTIADATSYTWSYSGTGATVSGTTISVTIDFAVNATSGNLTVTGNNSCGSGTVSPNFAVAVNPPPVATFTYTGNPYLCSAANPLPTFSGGGVAGTFSSTAGLVFISTATGQVNLSASLSGTYTVTNTIAPAGGCGIVSATSNITISSDLVWAGTISSDWNDPNNWSCGHVPGSTAIVQIPSSAPNMPVLSPGTIATVNNLTISNGSSLTISGNTIQIAGTISNSGTFTADNGTIEMNGSSAQVIGTGVFTGNTIKNLTINNTAGVTLQGPLNVSGIVNVSAGSLASDGNLTLVSTATGTALIDGSGNGNITGNVTMQRYLADGFGYKYFSSPMQGATVAQFGDDMMSLTPTTLYKYVEDRPASGWVSYSKPDSLIRLLRGYAVNFGNSHAVRTVDITAPVNNGNVAITLKNNNRPVTKGFHLVGNPYPSPVDWAIVSAGNTNIDNGVYFFKAGTDQFGGTYSSYVNGESTGGTNLNIIQSMQGFFVHVSNGTTGVLRMTNAARLVNFSQPFVAKKGGLKTMSAKGGSHARLRLTLRYSDDMVFADPMLFYVDDTGTPEFEGAVDALKLLNTDLQMPNIYSVATDGTIMSINAIPPITTDFIKLPLGIKLNRSAGGTVIFKLQEIDPSFTGMRVFLTDITAGVEQDLLPDKEYTITLPKGEYLNRFYLNFSNTVTSNRKTETDHEIFRAYSTAGILKAEVNKISGGYGVITVFNFAGQKLFSEKIYDTGYQEFNTIFREGIYLVNYSTGSYSVSRKLFIQRR